MNTKHSMSADLPETSLATQIYVNGSLGNAKVDKAPNWSEERGSSLCFDGSNDFVTVPSHHDLELIGNSLTLACWVKRSSATSGYLMRKVYIRKVHDSHGYQLWITSTGALQLDLLLRNRIKTVTSATTIPLNTWTHVAARYDGRELRVFIDGVKDTAVTTARRSLEKSSAALWIGRYTYNMPEHHLNGCLDDVIMYNRALTDAEITTVMNHQAESYEYHHTNVLGSNIIITDNSKNVVARYYYDVFGAVRSEVDTTDNVRKFTGKEYESDVKLYHFPGRPIGYDPYIGRFNQRDPVGEGGNWYLYTSNNPMKFVDPSGLSIIFVNSSNNRVKISNVSQLEGFNIGRLSTRNQVLFYALFGTTSTGDAGDAKSFLDLSATKLMLTNLINSSDNILIKFKDLGHKEAMGHFDQWPISTIAINNHSSPDTEKTQGYAMTLTALTNENTPTHRDFKSLRITMAHELQHAHDHYKGIPSDVPKGTDAWRGEYSAYRTEFNVAHQLGKLSGEDISSVGYFHRARGNAVIVGAGPTNNPYWAGEIVDAATSGH